VSGIRTRRTLCLLYIDGRPCVLGRQMWYVHMANEIRYLLHTYLLLFTRGYQAASMSYWVLAFGIHCSSASVQILYIVPYIFFYFDLICVSLLGQLESGTQSWVHTWLSDKVRISVS